MPELSRFYGIVIQMHFGDHPPPHFHALYGSSKAVLDIERSPSSKGVFRRGLEGLLSSGRPFISRSSARLFAGPRPWSHRAALHRSNELLGALMFQVQRRRRGAWAILATALVSRSISDCVL